MESYKQLLLTLAEELKDIITSAESNVPREQQLLEIKNKINVIMGFRRVGKTQFVMQQIQHLLADKVTWEQILYINFEDDRLLPIESEKLAQLIDAFYSLYPENHNRMCYLFLDEIQNVENWPIVVRRFLDTKKTKIYLTGSSSKLLSKEIATSLRGRSISTEIWPYSFTEYLHAKQQPIPVVTGKKSIDLAQKHLKEYLFHGGFPESIETPAPLRNKLLQDYVDLVILRDIVERYKISNISLIKHLIKTLLASFSGNFSINKCFNDLKSQGIAVSKQTLFDYLSHIEDAYLAFTVSLYSESVRKTQNNPRKVYVVDTGLVKAYSMSTLDNMGRLFENLVYLDLRRKGHEIHFYLTSERYEIDFFTRDPEGKLHLYQVAWNINEKATLEREMRALEQAEKELGIKGSLITPENYLQNGGV